jgi:hypothetical protein
MAALSVVAVVMMAVPGPGMGIRDAEALLMSDAALGLGRSMAGAGSRYAIKDIARLVARYGGGSL